MCFGNITYPCMHCVPPLPPIARMDVALGGVVGVQPSGLQFMPQLQVQFDLGSPLLGSLLLLACSVLFCTDFCSTVVTGPYS